MGHTIQMPALEQPNHLVPRDWMVLDVRGTGIAQVLPDVAPKQPLVMEQAYACLHRFIVEEGETVGPGQVVAEVLVDNIIQDVYALGHGIVSGLVKYMQGDVIRPGDVMVHVHPRSDRSGRQKGLVPKPSTAMRFARFGR